MQALDANPQTCCPGAVIHSIDPETFAGTGGISLMAYAGQRPVAGGALRPAPDGSCEVKRMFVLATELRGDARAILAALEHRARQMEVMCSFSRPMTYSRRPSVFTNRPVFGRSEVVMCTPAVRTRAVSRSPSSSIA